MDLAAELSSLASHLFRGSVCAIPFNRETSVAAVAGLFFSAKERCVAKLERWKVTIFFLFLFCSSNGTDCVTLHSRRLLFGRGAGWRGRGVKSPSDERRWS